MDRREQIARRAAREIQDGYCVNLGIGIPTLVANYIPAGMEVVLQSENGMLGVGPYPLPAEIDPDLQNVKNYIVTSEFGIAADLNADKSLSLNVFLDDDYESQPAMGREKNDAKLVGAIDYKF